MRSTPSHAAAGICTAHGIGVPNGFRVTFAAGIFAAGTSLGGDPSALSWSVPTQPASELCSELSSEVLLQSFALYPSSDEPDVEKPADVERSAEEPKEPGSLSASDRLQV